MRSLWFRPGREPIEVRLLSKPGCHLCEEMKRVLARAARGLAVRVEEIDIDSDPELAQRYGDQIPVLFINGRKAFKYRVTEKALRHRLRVPH